MNLLGKTSSSAIIVQQKIIFDTDLSLGEPNKDVDDGLALIMTLNSPEIHIVAIFAVFGNTSLKKAEKNIHDLLNLYSIETFYPEIITGATDRSDWEKKKVSSGITRMAHIIQENPSEISIVAIGPLTNIALLFYKYPETMSLVKNLIIMGGSINKWEFNFANDPNATEYVLHLPIPTFICGYEVCCAQKFTRDHYRQLQEKSTLRSRYLTHEIYSWFKLNWKNPQKLHLGRGFYPFDPTAIAYLLKPELFQGILIPATHDTVPSDFQGATRFKFALKTRVDRVQWAQRKVLTPQEKQTWVHWALKIDSQKYMKLLLSRLY